VIVATLATVTATSLLSNRREQVPTR